MNKRVAVELEAFRRFTNPGPFDYEWCAHFDGGQHEQHVVFGIMVHGNEYGSLPAAIRVVRALEEGQLRFGGRVSIFIGNPEAGLQDQRFLEADLNRVFTHTDTDSHEHRRAREIMPLLDACDLFIDFHQTILETRQPFYIFPWNAEGWRWARTLQAAPVWVTRNPGQAFSTGTCCTDEYVRNQHKPGLTIELSEKGFNANAAKIAEQAMVDTLSAVDTIARKEASLNTLASAQPDLAFYHTVHREPFTEPDLSLREGIVNFQPVAQGEVLSAPHTPDLIAPGSGMVLFPKYPPRPNGVAASPVPKEIYRIIEPLPGHPSAIYGSTPRSEGGTR